MNRIFSRVARPRSWCWTHFDRFPGDRRVVYAGAWTVTVFGVAPLMGRLTNVVWDLHEGRYSAKHRAFIKARNSVDWRDL